MKVLVYVSELCNAFVTFILYVLSVFTAVVFCCS